MERKNISKIALALLAALASSSCSRPEKIASVSENDLFTLNYGNFEDELNVFDLASAGSINTFMTMRDGFFYIANGESKRILELNSYGDLLSLYYNEDSMYNLDFADENSGNSTKKAVSYPFNKLGPVAVDADKRLYAVDTLPPERHEMDEERQLLLSNIVLRFDSDGKFIDYIGQQGPGGTPFSFVKRIYATKDGELVVVCCTNGGFDVFWFGTNGFLLYQLSVNEDNVPKLQRDGAEGSAHLSIENVVPDFSSHKVYLKIDYYEDSIDSDLKVQSGIDYAKTMLYPLDVTTGAYEDGFDIPAYEYSSSEGLSQEIETIPFDFLGVTENGWFFFMIPVDDGYLVQMVQPDGQRVVKRHLSVDHGRILYHSIALSDSGIVSGLFVRRENAEVVWWRTDSLIASFGS